MLQRYVSKELTHFVGRKLCSDDERYKLLLRILKSGQLMSSRPPTHIIKSGGMNVEGNVSIDGSKSFSTGEMFHAQVVCFCDIPLHDLGIHMGKYSKFGLSFQKSFLLQKGANPVFYLAIESTFYTNFDETIKQILYAHSISMQNREGNYNIKEFMDFIISFMKPFKKATEDDSEENYYMEREWRLWRSVDFRLEDVIRIILPKDYIVRLKNDLDDYVGEIIYAESIE